ncbi:hypothetical protein L873DRAFT_1844388 [Choiromyces venosus 120613-1]|uniref:DUF4604 domain-containing protein n=1 Tax=Choiromyces venosus 120613-1 TaxID=1336337 RepID=A0A3N4JIT8_9PEZI|nr:hypothetical protein L873DRAFT_1844388 [Choiromyces venosus 120613-1]
MSKGSKNLTYEMEEPAFLRRLRQQHSGGGGPDRYIVPRNKKRATDEDDDAPTYVLDEESGETLSRKEFEAMNNGEVLEGKEGEEEEGGIKIPEEKEPATKKLNVTEVGGKGKKRKVAKIIGDGDGEEDAAEKDDNNKGQEKEGTEKKKKGKAGGKVKKTVKLSFGDDE